MLRTAERKIGGEWAPKIKCLDVQTEPEWEIKMKVVQADKEGSSSFEDATEEDYNPQRGPIARSCKEQGATGQV